MAVEEKAAEKEVAEEEADEEEAFDTLENLSNEVESDFSEVDRSSPVKKRLRSAAGPDEFEDFAPKSKLKKAERREKAEKARNAGESEEDEDESYDSELERQKEAEQLKTEILEHLRKKDEPLTL